MKEKVIEVLIKYVNPALSNEDVEACENLEDLGLDSLNFIKIVMELENKYDIEFDEMATPYDFNTVDKFVSYIEENI